MKRALQARAQVQGEPSWWMRETAEGVEWTDTAPLVLSGWTPLYTTPQPAQATQAEVRDAGIEQVLTLAHSYADAKLMRYGALGIKEPPDPAAAFVELRRAILALRPERVPMTPASRDVIMATRTANADADEWPEPWAYQRGWNDAEAHHGITAQAKGEQ